MTPARKHLALAAVVLVAVALPFYLTPFANSQLTLVWIYATAVLGLNLLTGYTGQISLAQGAFFGIGAYAAAICLEREIVAPLLTIPLAAAIALIGGLLLGLPALRVRGLYLAVVTLAVAIALPPVIKRLDGLTGGASGLVVDSLSAPAEFGLADDQAIYFVALAVLALGFLLAHRARSGRAGRALVAVRDGELLATAFGVRVARVKLQAFAVSAALGGAAGGVYTLATGFVAPESFTMLVSLNLVIAMVIGGSTGLAGAVVGAFFIVYAPTYAADVDENLTGLVYGAALLLCMYLLPGGVASLPGRVAALARRRLGAVVRRPVPATRTAADNDR